MTTNDDHARVSEEGKAMGYLTSRMAEEGGRLLKAKGLTDMNLPTLRDDMCPSCAFRRGTVPNGCLQTQMDALKAIVEGVPFLCHAPKDGRMCAGYIAARAAHVARPLPTSLTDMVAKYEFSGPDIENPQDQASTSTE